MCTLIFLVIVLSYSSKAFHWLLPSPDVRFLANFLQRSPSESWREAVYLEVWCFGKRCLQPDAFNAFAFKAFLICTMLLNSESFRLRPQLSEDGGQSLSASQSSGAFNLKPEMDKMTRKGPNLEDLVLLVFNSLDVIGYPGEWELQWKPKWKRRKQKPCGRNSRSTPPSSWSGDSIPY